MAKAGQLKKLYILTIMIPYQMWLEYGKCSDFFNSLTEDELEDFEYLYRKLLWLDENEQRCQFSRIRSFFGIINKLCDYMIVTNRDELRIWKEIKEYVE